MNVEQHDGERREEREEGDRQPANQPICKYFCFLVLFCISVLLLCDFSAFGKNICEFGGIADVFLLKLKNYVLLISFVYFGWMNCTMFFFLENG